MISNPIIFLNFESKTTFDTGLNISERYGLSVKVRITFGKL
jgi:hypothetical protein